MELQEKTLGPDDREVATCAYNLASTYRVLGRYTEAEALMHRVVQISELHPGEACWDLEQMGRMCRAVAKSICRRR